MRAIAWMASAIAMRKEEMNVWWRSDAGRIAMQAAGSIAFQLVVTLYLLMYTRSVQRSHSTLIVNKANKANKAQQGPTGQCSPATTRGSTGGAAAAAAAESRSFACWKFRSALIGTRYRVIVMLWRHATLETNVIEMNYRKYQLIHLEKKNYFSLPKCFNELTK